MIIAVIIDDENNSRISLAGDIKNHCPEVNIVAEADSVSTGIEVIKKWNPDVVFLDVIMADGTGFDLVERLAKEKGGIEAIGFKIIFTTAYDRYAINAIKFSALDYLLKPVEPDELKAAVNRVPVQKTDSKNLDVLIDNLKQLNKTNKKIVLNTTGNIYVYNVSDIIRCKSDRNYTTFFLKDGKSLLVSKTLKEYEEMLKDFDFIRVHHSHLINVNYLIKYVKSQGGHIIMSDDANIPVAQRRKEEILKILSSF